MFIRGRVGFWVLWGGFFIFSAVGRLTTPPPALPVCPSGQQPPHPEHRAGLRSAGRARCKRRPCKTRHTDTHVRTLDTPGGSGRRWGAGWREACPKLFKAYPRADSNSCGAACPQKTAAARKAPCGGCSHFVESSGKITSRTRQCTRSRTLPAAS